MSAFFGLIGLLVIVISVVLLIVNAIRKKPLKIAGIGTIAGVVLFIIGVSIPSPASEEKNNLQISAAGNQDLAAKSGAQTNTKPAESASTLSKEGVSSNVKIVVEGVETKDQIGSNQFVRANAQGVFKIVKLSLTNNQKDAITVDSNSFKLLDSKGREFSHSTEAQIALESSLTDKTNSFLLKQLNPGLTAEGYIVFDVPKDATNFVLSARGGFTGEKIKLKVE